MLKRLILPGSHLLCILAWLIMVEGCTSTDAAKQKPVDDVKRPSDLEAELGRIGEWQILQTYRVDDNPSELNRIRRVGRRLAAVADRSKVSYSFALLDTKDKNAFSLSNGRIFVTRGMVEILVTDDDLAVVLAHEFAHINHKHFLQKFQRQDATLWQRLLVSGTVGMVPLLGQKIGYLVLDQGYDQNQEIEADLTGLDYMARAGFDPQAALVVFARFARDPDMQKNQSLFSTHPGDRTRLERMRAYLETPQSGQSQTNEVGGTNQKGN